MSQKGNIKSFLSDIKVMTIITTVILVLAIIGTIITAFLNMYANALAQLFAAITFQNFKEPFFLIKLFTNIMYIIAFIYWLITIYQIQLISRFLHISNLKIKSPNYDKMNPIILKNEKRIKLTSKTIITREVLDYLYYY